MKNVRKFLLVVVFIGVAIAAQAQNDREIIPVDWKGIEKLAKKNPEKIKEQVARLSAEQLDTAMTWEERIVAYYGQSYFTPFTDHNEGRDLDKLYRDSKYEECLAASKKLLEKNPVSMKALFNAAMAISQMLNDSTRHYDVTLKEGQVYYNRLSRIFNTIATTGYGTKEHPFFVTAVSDEYLFMRYYLEIWEIKSQFLEGCCDGFELGEMSEYYTRPDIYFEITRVLQLESEMLQGK